MSFSSYLELKKSYPLNTPFLISGHLVLVNSFSTRGLYARRQRAGAIFRAMPGWTEYYVRPLLEQSLIPGFAGTRRVPITTILWDGCVILSNFYSLFFNLPLDRNNV